MKITKKSLLATLQGSKVKATMIGGLAAEDWPQVVAQTKAAHPDARESERAIHFAGAEGQERFILKPRFTRERLGTLSAGSTRYAFCWEDQQSEGQIKDLQLSADGTALELQMVGGARMCYAVAEA
ncbi:MAG: hypothetical protein KGZ70_13010 [Hydrogenophaga sp.]|nr:hypothetical protein [Hydrogenophaga sp.]